MVTVNGIYILKRNIVHTWDSKSVELNPACFTFLLYLNRQCTNVVFWLTQDRGLAKKMKMIQEQIERDQKAAEARIPKAQPLPYTTKSPIVSFYCSKIN